MNELVFGLVEPQALHIAVDLQRLFAEPGEWFTPTLPDIVPAVGEICQRHAQQTVFTRFITPHDAVQAHGVWQRYYQRWTSVTLERMDASQLDIITDLQQFIPPANIIDKTTHSAFESQAFQQLLQQQQPATLIFTGVETDVCVLASVMTAVDQGYRVIVVADAVTSSSAQGHRATLDAVLPRFDQQIEIVDVATLLNNWTA